MKGALLVVGTTSGAGKSTVVAGLCRLLVREGGHVAPFKAQNMSNHAAVTPDGGEIGRAQAMQAAAAKVTPDRRMNPILLKPTAGMRSHVIVMGDEVSTTDAIGYGPRAQQLKPVVLDALTSLRGDCEMVVAEGAGGAAEINLLDRDLVNLPLARAAGIPAVLVVDIDRGGAFASAHGTIDLLPPELAATVHGIVINQFRGDASLLADGIAELEARHGVPVLGVLPYLDPPPLLGLEDSLDVPPATAGVNWAADPIRAVAVRMPHLANPSDLDPLVVEPAVDVRWSTSPAEIADADLVVLPGSRSTVADLEWLRAAGIADALARTEATVVGICAGFQMMGQTIDDEIESGRGRVDGLGLLDTSTTFAEPKVVRIVGGPGVLGYEIRFGRPGLGAEPWLQLADGPEGAVQGRRFGTSVHGVFDGDGLRRAFLTDLAADRGRRYEPGPMFVEVLEQHHDRLADWIASHLDVEQILAIAATASDPSEPPGW